MTVRQCSCGLLVSWWVGSCPRCWADLTEPSPNPKRPPLETMPPKIALLSSTIISALPVWLLPEPQPAPKREDPVATASARRSTATFTLHERREPHP